MHVTTGGWLGPTFALARLDDSSDGKKSRIRRSKEERKGMVETFIKRYQKSNNGDFPSLALTRKEVGGSFYTVREIVREIIQENRVLGPPKLPPGDQNMGNLDSFLEHYPLGSTSIDPLEHRVSTEHTQTLLKEYEFRTSKALNITKRKEEVKDQGYTELLMDRGDEEQRNDDETVVLEEKTLNGAICTNVQKPDTKKSCISLQQSTLDGRAVISNISGGNSQKRRSNATLNRINLESWEAALRKSNGHETNPLVTFIKAFITSFVKFWSE